MAATRGDMRMDAEMKFHYFVLRFDDASFTVTGPLDRRQAIEAGMMPFSAVITIEDKRWIWDTADGPLIVAMLDAAGFTNSEIRFEDDILQWCFDALESHHIVSHTWQLV